MATPFLAGTGPKKKSDERRTAMKVKSNLKAGQSTAAVLD